MDNFASLEQPDPADPSSVTPAAPTPGAFAQPSSSSPSPSSSPAHLPVHSKSEQGGRNDGDDDGDGEDEDDRAAERQGNSAPATPPPGPGRPSSLNRNKLTAICAFIRMTGVSDTAAASMAGISRSAISRWKAENEEAACELERARTEYLLPRLKIIGETVRKDGELDWRAQAWLVKFANPEEYGPPSRRRKVQEVEVPLTEEEQQAAVLAEGCTGWANYETGGVVTPAMLVALQAKRQEVQRKMNPEAYDADVAKGKAPREKAKTPEDREVELEELKLRRWRALEKMGDDALPNMRVGRPKAYGGDDYVTTPLPASLSVRNEPAKM